MPELDSLKEKLNSLRTFFLADISAIVLLTGGLVSSLRANQIDWFVTLGVIIDFLLILTIPWLVYRIHKITEEVKRL